MFSVLLTHIYLSMLTLSTDNLEIFSRTDIPLTLTHHHRLETQKASEVVRLSNRHTLRPNDRVARDKMEVEVGQTMVYHCCLNSRLVSLAECRTGMNS